MNDPDRLNPIEEMMAAYYRNIDFLKEAVKTLREDYGYGYVDPEVVLRQFDLSIQCALLAVSLADGKIQESEIKAIALLGNHTDLMEFVNETKDATTTGTFAWEDIPQASPYTVTIFQKKIEDNIDGIIYNFGEFIAAYMMAVETEEGKAFFNQFLINVHHIAHAFTEIDGDRNEHEVYVHNQKVNDYYTRNVIKRLQELQDDDDEDPKKKPAQA